MGADSVLPDSAHLFHIKGFGQDFAASCIMLLARLGLWPGRGIDSRLQAAYKVFRMFCTRAKLNTTIDGFSKRSFDMKKKLVDIVSGSLFS